MSDIYNEQLEALRGNVEIKADAVQGMSVEEQIAAMKAEFDAKIAESNDRCEKLKLTLEKKEVEKEVKRVKPTDGIKVTGSFNDSNVLDEMAKPYMEKDRDKRYRYISNHEQLRSLRRSQGFQPVLNDDGDEVRYMDMVLAKMPEGQYQKEIIAPKERRRRIHAAAIGQKFHEAGDSLGVETFGEVTYDKKGTLNE